MACNYVLKKKLLLLSPLFFGHQYCIKSNWVFQAKLSISCGRNVLIVCQQKQTCSKEKILSDPACHLCGCLAEDVMHTLWECEAVKSVWAGDWILGGLIGLKLHRGHSPNRLVEFWLNLVFLRFSPPQHGSFGRIYRNKTRLNKSSLPNHLTERIPEAVCSFLSAFKRNKDHPRSNKEMDTAFRGWVLKQILMEQYYVWREW